MKHRLILSGLLLLVLASAAWAAFDVETGTVSDAAWQSGVPLGGIGCGKLEILTDGSLGYYTGNHNWDRPTGRLKGAFAAVFANCGGRRVGRMLRLNSRDEYSRVPNIAGVDYSGWFPTASLKFRDPELPVGVKLLAWSPLIPNQVSDSALPVASFRFTIDNPSKDTADVSLLFSWPNMVGFGGRPGALLDDLSGNTQHLAGNPRLSAVVFEKGGAPPTLDANVIGKYALCVAKDGFRVEMLPQYDASSDTLPFWTQFEAIGSVYGVAASNAKAPAGGLVVSTKLKPGESRTIDLMLVWHFPHHVTVRQIQTPTGAVAPSTDGTGAAFDGDPATRWTTARPMVPGDSYVLDLGSAQRMSRVVLDSAASGTDYPRGYKIELSDDERAWRTAAHATSEQVTAAQASGVLDIRFPESSGRYLRVVQTGSVPGWFWSIHEISIYGSDGQKLSLQCAKGTAYLAQFRTRDERTNVGHYYSRKFADPIEIADYVFANKDRLLRQTQEWQDLVRKSNLPSWLKVKLVNCAFSIYACSILTRDGRFAVQESPVDMGGATGTMDQRMAAHAFYTQMFPALDQSELRLFAQCQDLVKPVADGRITHFDGNIHEVIGDPNVGYGVTDWPDLSCSWIMQVVKLYRWTGDRMFLNDMWPHVKHALAWLKSADQDGDQIPEGGSTYDYETLPRGAFCYSAICYLGALRTGIDMAGMMRDFATQRTYEAQFKATQDSLMKNLWNGKYFIKHWVPKTGKRVENSFVAQLAGDWLSRLSGAGRTLSPQVTESAIREIIARHVRPFKPIPPMETTPEGRLAFEGCYVLQHEPYVGCEAIYEGYTDDGLDTIKRIYDAAWTKNRNPWHQPLAFTAPTGEQGGLVSYMTCPTTWHVLNALSGSTLDLNTSTLYISPRIGNSLPELHMPVFFSRFWFWLDYSPARKSLKLTVIRNFGTPERIYKVAADRESPIVKLSQPFVTKPGAVLDLSTHIDKLVLYPTPKVVDYEVKAPPAPRPGIQSDKWTGDSGFGEDPTMPGNDISLAIDGADSTRWTTGAFMRPGDWFMVDMHETRKVKTIVLDSKGSKGDYPRGCTVQTSLDGKAWQTAAELSEQDCAAGLKDGVLSIEIPPTEARFIRTTQRGRSEASFWSIHEFQVFEGTGRTSDQ